VVESGSFREVPKLMRMLETTRLTEARTKSKAGASLGFFTTKALLKSNLRERNDLMRSGVILPTPSEKERDIRTIDLESWVLPKRSAPLSWLASPTSVLVTVRALRDVHRVITITNPAISR